ncbi:MAG: YigZ family protein [Bacteroidales bacterium]|nr:YigZ family protein [Bacteroidales bacterium]
MPNKTVNEEAHQDTYKSIAGIAEGFYREKGSRFLAFASPAVTTEEAEHFVNHLREKYHDARHHCYAWIIGAAGTEVRYSDAGEPSGTAGKPILGQIQHFGLRDVVVVVVRYFGGILLGTGGLSRAYKEAAHNCLQNATIVSKMVGSELSIVFPYKTEGLLNRLFQEEKISVIKKDFSHQCIYRIMVPRSRKEQFLLRLQQIKDVKVISE